MTLSTFSYLPAACPAGSTNAPIVERSKQWRKAAKYLASALFAGAAFLPFASHAQQQDYAPQTGGGSQQIQIDTGKAAETVFAATNAYRTQSQIGELAWNNPLWQAAQQYAEFLAANRASGHDADGKTPQIRAGEQGYRCPVLENAYSADPAITLDDEETAALKAFDTWKNTPPDNDTMLSPAWADTGVGAAAWNHDGQTYYVFVQMFGRPCGGGPALFAEPAPGVDYAETYPVPVPVCPSWDPVCHGCPAWNPYCHKCPPWDPGCHKCPSWNPDCNKCPPWDADCHKCPPWNLNCHKCPPWNPGCNKCPPSNPDCRRHACPNGGVWPLCKLGRICPNGGIWPNCNKLGGHFCPNGGVWPRCAQAAGIVLHKPFRWYRPRPRSVSHPVRQFNQRRNFQRRLDTIRHNQRQHFRSGRHR